MSAVAMPRMWAEGQPRHIAELGTPPSAPSFALWVHNVRRRVLFENYDSCIVITGYEGSGKSTLGYKVARAFQPSFTPTQVAFDEEATLAMARDAPSGSVIDYDEGVNGLYAREAMSTENRTLTTTAMVARARNLFWIICIPSLHNLDLYFREHRVTNWIHVTRRGEALFHVAKRSPYHAQTWWQPFLRYQYGPVVTDDHEAWPGAKEDWEMYVRLKNAYIDMMTSRNYDRADKARARKNKKESE